jgi:hypothetical protein
VKKLYDAVVAPIATKRTKGAWHRQWKLVSAAASHQAAARRDDAAGR